MFDSAIPTEVVHRVLAPLGVERVERLAPGFSGAFVAFCRASSGADFALKRWPKETPRSRIEEVHRVVQHSASNGCDFVAKPQWIDATSSTLFAFQGSHWELSAWRSGQAATPDASRNRIEAGARAIAQFHASVTVLDGSRQIAPAVLNRLTRLEERSAQIPRVLESTECSELNPELARVLLDATQLVRWKWDEVHSRIHRSLSQYLHREVRTQYVLRDVHRQHVLFENAEVTGLIDFDALRVDTPATDLSRWVGSFLAGGHDGSMVWESALAGFHAESALKDGSETEFEARMAADLCFASTWISLTNWLFWLLCERRMFSTEPSIVASRVRELVRVASNLEA
ncbi:MAG: phosphotransferase [Rubripirellula sp.]